MLSIAAGKNLRDFSLDVELYVAKGETLVLIGENGAGKSTLLNIISGLAKPDYGEIKLGEKILYSHSGNISVRTEERNTGHLFQSYALFPHLSVFENVAFGLKCREIPKEEIKEIVDVQLEIMHIKELSSVNVEELSGGQRQRVALARSLVLKPEILLLDEPLSAVDVRMQAGMRQELRRIIKDANIPCIIVSHILTDALELGDRVAIIENGKIIQEGKPEDVFRRPACGFVARFTGMENLFRGRAVKQAEDTEIEIDDLKLHAITELEGDVIAGIRAEEIIFSREPVDTTARNILNGVVRDIQWNGSVSKIIVDAGVLITGVISQQSLRRLDLQCGEEIFVVFKASAIQVFPV